MPSVTHKLDEVYGVTRRQVPLTYVSRPSVDDRFLNEMRRDQHLVIYGTSKQGKSSLLRVALNEDDYIEVHCATNWSKETLYSAILKEIGVAIVETTTSTRSRGSEASGSVGAEVGHSILAKITAKVTGAVNENSTESETTRMIPIDLSNATDIIRLMSEIEFTKFVVVEDFHYLPLNVQRQFANDLKVFFETSPVSFIIVGVWLEANRLIVYNGDLAQRITSIPADTWTAQDLAKVVRNGEPLLNIRFSDDVVDALVDGAQFNVGTLQDAVRQMCLARGLYVTANDTLVFDDTAAVRLAYGVVSEQLATRYANFIKKFSEGLRDQVLHMYKWIMHAVIVASPEDRRAGLKTMDILRDVQAHHPRGTGIFQNSVESALTNVAKVQVHAEITPVIFDYDETHKRLTVVDNGLLVYLVNTPTEEALAFLANFANEREDDDEGAP